MLSDRVVAPHDTTLETQPLPQPGDAAPEEAPPAGPMLLLVYHRNGADAVALEPERAIVVGRESPSDRIVRDSSVSRQHARFTLRDGVLTVEDLRSKNGTWRQGERVERAELGVGDEVALGSVLVVVYARDARALESVGLESHEVWQSMLEAEIRRARFFGRSLALVMVCALGKDAAHVSRWSSTVLERLRPVDRVGLYSSDVLEILVPEVTPTDAHELARSITKSEGGRPMLVASIAVFPSAAGTADGLIGVCRTALVQASATARVVSAADRADARPSPSTGDGRVVLSPAMRSVYEQVERIAASSIPVLVTGETGTGKEVVARALHERSGRRGQLVCLNCGAIPANLVESTLFGHERGAFTGADTQRKGAFEEAHQGTLLLDEIGELPLAVQATLLRVLETKRVMRVGSTREIESTARIIAATHRDLESMARDGRFRTDLMYRLNVITLAIPPLRDRSEEIRALAEYFLGLANATNGRQVRGIDPQVLALLEAYEWPGNVRELRNAIERAVVIARSERIHAEDLPERVRCPGRISQTTSPPAGMRRLTAPEIKQRVKKYEAELILDALKAAGGNQTEAAKRLGMPLRTFVRKIRSLDLRPR